MAIKLIVLLGLIGAIHGRFPRSLQNQWGYLDSYEYAETFQPRVVGGSDAGPEEAPFQISMLKNYVIMKSHICGGSLITPRTVITAAHCTNGQKASSLNVRYGTTKRSSSEYADMVVSRIVQHEAYNADTIENDISLLILSKAITPSANVQVIEIETKNLTKGEPVKVYGWGLTNGQSQTLPENLQVGRMSIVNNDDCNKKWESVNAVRPGMICALDKTQSACNGDSGGPLVSAAGNLAGIVSWGPSGCPTGDYMTIFTRPNYYQKWIVANWME